MSKIKFIILKMPNQSDPLNILYIIGLHFFKFCFEIDYDPYGYLSFMILKLRKSWKIVFKKDIKWKTKKGEKLERFMNMSIEERENHNME